MRQPPPDRSAVVLIKTDDIRRLTGFDPKTIKRLVDSGEMPKPVVGYAQGRAPLWNRKVILRWLGEEVAA